MRGNLYFYNANDFDVTFTITEDNLTLSGKYNDESSIKVEVNITTSGKTIYIAAEAQEDRITRTLFLLQFPKDIGQRYSIKYNGVTKHLSPIAYIQGDPAHRIIWTVHNGHDEFVSPTGALKIEKFVHPRDAKKLWKYINDKHYASKWIWDSFMGYYDCYCKACAVGKQKSWLGNPDIGFVRSTNQISMNTFEYKNKYYNPCSENEYLTLTFWTEEQYNAVREKYRPKEGTSDYFETEWPDFDIFWHTELTQEEVDSNGNVRGGGWLLPDGTVKGNVPSTGANWSDEDIPNDAVKVVTFGWHQTDPEGAVRCPVCNDIYNIMRSGWKGMLPLHLRIIEKLLNKGIIANIREYFNRRAHKKYVAKLMQEKANE